MRFVLSDGGVADVLETDGTFVAIRASTSSPPGATLLGTAEGGGAAYRIKVRGCRRTEDGPPPMFRIEGRFVDLTQDQRAALLTKGS